MILFNQKDNKVMEQYIPKSAVVAEIEKLQDAIKATAIDNRISKEQAEAYKVCVKLRSFVENTIDAKDVGLDFEQELYKAFGQVKDFTLGMRIAKHFYELGMQASNPLTWENILKCIRDAMNYHLYAFQSADGQQKVYEEVLKRFKALKGE